MSAYNMKILVLILLYTLLAINISANFGYYTCLFLQFTALKPLLLTDRALMVINNFCYSLKKFWMLYFDNTLIRV